DCNISSSFDISFEIANQKLRLPSSIISTGKDINGTNKCESIITGSTNSTNSWIFGSAFIMNFYMVFDQTKSQFGIASRSDIDYGPTPVEIMIQVPIYLVETKCLKIIDQNRISQAFSVDSIDQNGYYNVGGNYLAQEGFTYSFYFYPNSIFNATNCSSEQYDLAYTNPLTTDITKNPWEIERSVYSV
ncbi:13739_t:CDS:2, partial [Gigaspora margarita]